MELSFAVALAWLGIFTVTDLRTRRVPNSLVLWAYASEGVALLLESALSHSPDIAVSLGLAGLILFAVGVIVQATGKDGALGGGDVKVFGLMGFGLGVYGFFGILLGMVVAGLFVGLRWALSKKPFRDPIPLVPFLACGSVLSVGLSILH